MPPKRARKAPLGAASTKTKAQKATTLPTQFQSRFKALESLYKKQVKALSASYTRLLKQVPKSVGKMTVREWLKQESCNALNGGSTSNENARPDVSTAPIASAMTSPDSESIHRRLTRSQSCIFQQLPETPSVSRTMMTTGNNGKIERRITLLRGSNSSSFSSSSSDSGTNGTTLMDSGCSIVLPLDDGKTLLEMDPTQRLDLSLLKREIGSQAREQVVRQVQELQSQLSALLAGMDED